MQTSKKLIVILLVFGFLVGMAVAYPIGHSNGVQATYKADLINPITDGITIGNNKLVDYRDVALNLERTNNFSDLVGLLKTDGLLNTLNGSGPFTIFAPNNGAFSSLSKAEKTSLTNSQNDQASINTLNYEIVIGTYTTAALTVMADNGETLISLEGEQLTPIIIGNGVGIKDAQGNIISIQTADAVASNGIIQEINAVPAL